MSFLDQPWSPTSVQVTVLQARGLRAKGKGGTNDAYALMQVGKDKYQTSVVEKSVAPVWKEEAAFELPQQGAAGGRGTLHVHVLHRALVGLDKLLGQAVIDLQLLAQDKNRSKSEWFKLLDKNGKADKDRGEVLVDIQFMKNNMTASMFDLSAVGKSRSRLGKLKDKVRGKKKEPDAASPSITQVLTESEEEDEVDEGKAPMSKEKKRLKIKSIFSHKSNLQRNLSQSMTVLPDKNSALSGSLSSGLNVDTSEGKKKFRFLKHKHSDSSDPKGSSQKHAALEKSNLCINGSHVYCEEPPLRVSRVGSNFSLASSGLGSMEDVPENSPPPVDLLPVIRQYTPWEEEEEEEEEQEKTEFDGLTDIQERTEEHTLKRLEEEQEREESQEDARKQEQEGVEKQEEEEEDEMLRKQELQRLEEERMRLDEEKEREDELTRQKEREHNEEVERLRNLELERLEAEKWRKEEEKRRDEERARQEEEEQERLAMEKKLEEEKRREEERARQEEEEQERLAVEKRLQEEKRRDEERARMEEEEEEQKRLALEDEKRRAEERARQEEEEQERKREEQERLALEKRLEEEERKREEAEQTRRLALERLEAKKVRLAEEEKRRQDEEEQLALVKRQEEEEEKKREEAERLRRHEVERLEVEKKRQEKEEERRRAEEKQRLAEEQQRIQQLELERLKKEKMRLEEEKRRVEEQARKKEEERVRRREEQKLFEEEQRRLEEEERRRNEEKEEEERERMAEEERKREEEKRRKEEEERLRKEEQEMKRQEAQVAEEKRKMEEKAQEAKMNEEKKESETREHVEKEEDRRIDDDDDDVRKEVPKKLKDEDKMDEACEEKSNQKAKTVLQDTQMDSSNPFDEGLTNNPFDDDLPNPFFRSKNRTSDQTFPKSCASSEASLGSNNTATDKKNTPLNQREKRAAPQPPGKTRSNIPADPTVPSKPSMEPLKDIQSKNASPATSPEQKAFPPKPAKRLAPSIPSADSKPLPATHTLNPFDDDDDGGNERATQDPGFVSRAPPVSQIPNLNAASQSKVKSMKVARAPVPPAKSAVVASRPPTLQSGGVEIQASVAGKVLESQENLSKESKPKTLQNGQGAGEKKDPPPAPARRLQPVKPLSQEPYPPTETQDEKGISPLGNSEKTVSVNKEKGPYSMLTREELISLAKKQEKQLQNKDKRIAELEQYIDNLLLRVMEEQPSILMSMKKLV
ncbi:uncharacterized protein LOC144090783 [Stigmatopora argus]